MNQVERITLLGLVCSFSVFCTSGENVNYKQPQSLDNGLSLPTLSDGKLSGDLYALLWSTTSRNTLGHKDNVTVNRDTNTTLPIDVERSKHLARCVDLFKRKHSQSLLKKYWTFVDKLIRPHFLHVCLSYLADFSKQNKSRQLKTVYKRQANSNQKYNNPSINDINTNGSNQFVKMTTASPAKEASNNIIPYTGENRTETANRENSADSTATATWVFISIGVALTILIVIIAALAVMYRSKTRGTKPMSTDTYSFLETVSKNRSLRSEDDVSVELYECTAPLSMHSNCQTAQPHNKDLTLFLNSCGLSIVADEFLEPASNTQKYPITACFRTCQEMDTVERAMSSSSFLNSQRDDGNRLRGGREDFHRRYVDVDYVHNDIDLKRPKPQSHIGSGWDQDMSSKGARYITSKAHCQEDKEEKWKASMYGSSREGGGRNGSNTSSSARSYICIPPTSPSENYIEAGSDDVSVRSTPPTKMAWLTKNLKVDVKNDIRNYQASLGTQTESDQDITAPMCKTVFGTPWQFGGTFTSRGGLLQAKDSDVCLVMTTNAVSKGEYIDIYGAVFTDTTEIRKKLNFPARESLITPVVEYHAVPVNHFNTSVCVRLPHAMPDEFDSSLIRVYTFSVDERGKVSISMVPLCNKAKNDGAYWDKGSDGRTIHVYTTHFSGYFCTLCETSSLPSICTMVFGSHVQITPTRREIRVILYIWDRRLTIKDYLERFRKQESDVDRQLLTDMQVPLLDDASSDSRLVMKMEVMGKEEDRSSWKHVSRPDGLRPLFKSLQVRKLSEIVHCCRQTDPIRVEWALENAPRQIPSAVFQCCIDIMHVHESTSDYETAMREGSDDLMRTFYVRDLKVVTHPSEELKPSTSVQLVDLKRALLEASDMVQTEKMCQEYGITVKDIGNFKKKYSTEEAIQAGLVDECLRRHGFDKFMNQLPLILERLQLTHIASALESRKILIREYSDLPGPPVTGTQTKPVAHVKKPSESVRSEIDSTRCKSPYRRSSSPHQRNRSSSPHQRNRSSSPTHRRRSKDDTKGTQRPDLHHQMSEKSDDVFFTNEPSNHPPGVHGQYRRNLSRERESRQSERKFSDRDRENRQSERQGFDRHREIRQSERQVFDRDRESRQSERQVFDRESRQSQRHVRHRHNSPPSGLDRDVNIDSQNVGYIKAKNAGQNMEEMQLVKNHCPSSSKADSALNSSSLPHSDISGTSSHFPSGSTADLSMVAHADPKDFAEPYPDEFLDDCLQQTYKKELAAQRNVFDSDSNDNTHYNSIKDRMHFSESGPQALPPESGQVDRSSFSDPVPPHQKLSGNDKLHKKPQLQDTDETMKKEFYATHTVV